MRPRRWSTVNGASKELNSALAHVQYAAEHTTDSDLKADYEKASACLQSLIDNERRENDEEDDDGW